MSDQDLQISLTGKDVSASDAFRALARAANQAAKSAGDSIQQMNRRVESESQNSLKATTSTFGNGLASWAQSGLAGVLGGIAASVTSTVTGVLADAGSAIMTQLKSSVIDYNGQLEQATIGFTTMLGSSGKAQAFLDQLQAFAKRTPFEFGDLTTYSQQMLAYGVQAKNVVPYLSALGDAAAGAGKSSSELGNAVLAFNQIAARGKVDLGDLNQLTNAGVPALAILADKYGVTKGALLEMVSAGKLASDDALPKLVAGIEHGTRSTAAFGGMMDKQSATLQGAMSNITDAMNQTLSKAFLPFFKVAERGANALAKFAGSKAVQTWADDTAKSVGKFVSMIGKAFNEIGKDKGVQKSFQQLGSAVGKLFEQIGPALKSLIPDFVRFAKEVLPAVVDVIRQVVANLPAAIDLFKKFGKFLADNGPAISGFIRGVGNIVSGMMKLSAVIDNTLLDLAAKFNGFRNWLGGFFAGASQWLVDAGTNIVKGLINGVAGMVGGAIDAVKGLVGGIVSGAKQFLGIASPSKVFRQIGSWVGEGLNKGLLGSIDQIKSTSKTMSDAVTSAFKKGTIGKGTELAALGAISKTTARLKTLSAERAKVLDKLADLKQSRSGVFNDTKAATIEAGNITSFGAPGDAVLGLQRLVSKTKTFTADLKKLVGKGVKGTLLTQLVDGWNSDPDTALATAQGLLANPTDLKQILSLQGQLSSAASSLGSYAAHSQYDSQVNAAAGKAKVLGWEMQAAARSGLRTVSRDLHINLNLNGNYAGTKDDLAKTIKVVIQDAIKKGVIPKNWATA